MNVHRNCYTVATHISEQELGTLCLAQMVPKGLLLVCKLPGHPLFFDAIKDTEFELKQYLNVTDKYDDILKDTRILITDYSSIAYDAFYRGCNVIFYWEEKDECMANYGPTTKLMLNEENVYGDICMNPYQLSKAIDINYFHGQDEVYQKRYSKLVDFHDGKNTERLITLLRKDEII